MSESESGRTPGGASSIGQILKDSPAVERLVEEAKQYARARGAALFARHGGKLPDMVENVTGGSGGGKAAAAGLRGLVEGKSAQRSMVGAAMTGLKEKVLGVFKGGGGGKSQSNPKVTHISESIDIGLPVSVVYNQWTQYDQFAKFMKGVEGVEQNSETETNWRVKVLWSHRTWKGLITEAVPDRRIAWKTEGPKGNTKGVITFHPLADDLTRVLLTMEYYPAGFFEKTGNIWRAGGRRTRLDLKHFRRFIAINGEETGAWRGEIRDGEVVKADGEAEGRGGAGREGDQEPEDRYEEQPDQDTAEEPEDEYEESEEEPEDEYEPEDEPEDEDEDEEYEEEDSEEEPEDEYEEDYDEDDEYEDSEEEPEDEYEEDGEEEEEPEEEPAPRRRRVLSRR